MKRLVLLLPFALLLSGCGLIANFIPDQEVGDVFGIGSVDNPSVVTAPAFVDPSELGSFLPEARAASDYEETELKFQDFELPNLYGFSIDGLRVTIGLGETVTLERDGASGTFPEAFTLTSFEGFVRVSDAEAIVPAVEYHFEEQPLSFEFVRAGSCTSKSCDYKSTATESARLGAMVFDIPESQGGKVRNLIRIASEGGENTAYVKVRVAADSDDSIFGFRPVFEIMNPSTVVSIGG